MIFLFQTTIKGKDLPVVEITATRINKSEEKVNVYQPPKFIVETGGKKYEISAKTWDPGPRGGNVVINGLNNALETCEKVKEGIKVAEKIPEKTKEILIDRITDYQKDVVSTLMYFTQNSEFVKGVQGKGPMDVLIHLSGDKKGEYNDHEMAGKALDLIEKNPVLKPLEGISYYTGHGNPYLTSLGFGKEQPSEILATKEIKSAPAEKDGSEYGKPPTNYDFGGMNITFKPEVRQTVKK